MSPHHLGFGVVIIGGALIARVIHEGFGFTMNADLKAFDCK